jgi:Amt family ammonium transporter
LHVDTRAEHVFECCALPTPAHCRFGLAFGESPPGSNGILGNPADLGGLMYGVGAAPLTALAATIPASVYFVFQLMFAVITPALLIGSIADR